MHLKKVSMPEKTMRYNVRIRRSSSYLNDIHDESRPHWGVKHSKDF